MCPSICKGQSLEFLQMQKKNVGASVLQRLKNAANEINRSRGNSEKVSVMTLVDQYAYTGFLRRLSQNRWKDKFSLKGGLMMLVITGDRVRPTRDVDLDGVENMSIEDLKSVIVEIISEPIGEDDGIIFDVGTLDVKKDRTDAMFNGAKITVRAQIGSAKPLVNVDVGFENVITPHLRMVEVPTQIKDEPPVQILMYPAETAIAEKFRAMVFYGLSNTRLKDFYDIQKYSQICDFSAQDLAKALELTCKSIGVEVPPIGDMECLGEIGAGTMSKSWDSFLKKNKIEAGSFEECQQDIRCFLGPAIDYLHGVAPEPGRWERGRGWEAPVSAPSLGGM